MASAMSLIKEVANTHMKRDLETGRKWVCQCAACSELRSLVGVDKLLSVRPLVREIEQLEDQLREIPDGPEANALMEQYLALYDKLADTMAS